MMIHDKNIVVATAGWNGKATSLVTVGADKFLLGEEHDIELVAGRLERGGSIIVG